MYGKPVNADLQGWWEEVERDGIDWKSYRTWIEQKIDQLAEDEPETNNNSNNSNSNNSNNSSGTASKRTSIIDAAADETQFVSASQLKREKKEARNSNPTISVAVVDDKLTSTDKDSENVVEKINVDNSSNNNNVIEKKIDVSIAENGNNKNNENNVENSTESKWSAVVEIGERASSNIISNVDSSAAQNKKFDSFE